MDAEHVDFMVPTDPNKQLLVRATGTLSTGRPQNRKEPKMQPVRLSFCYCVIWGCELGYLALNPPAGRDEGL